MSDMEILHEFGEYQIVLYKYVNPDNNLPVESLNVRFKNRDGGYTEYGFEGTYFRNEWDYVIYRLLREIMTLKLGKEWPERKIEWPEAKMAY